MHMLSSSEIWQKWPPTTTLNFTSSSCLTWKTPPLPPSLWQTTSRQAFFISKFIFNFFQTWYFLSFVYYVIPPWKPTYPRIFEPLSGRSIICCINVPQNKPQSSIYHSQKVSPTVALSFWFLTVRSTVTRTDQSSFSRTFSRALSCSAFPPVWLNDIVPNTNKIKTLKTPIQNSLLFRFDSSFRYCQRAHSLQANTELLRGRGSIWSITRIKYKLFVCFILIDRMNGALTSSNLKSD